MSLNSLISYISNSQIITELVKRIKNNNELNIIGSSRYAKSIIINFRRILDKRIRNILNIKEIVMPIFKALDLNKGLSRDLVRDAKAIALSADSNNSKIINIGKSVRISDQLST